MANKLYYYSNLSGVLGWATDANNFRRRNGLSGGTAVRVAHCEIPTPAGYEKTGRGLAHEPIVKVGTPTKVTLGKTTKSAVNFYELGIAILGANMTGLDN